MKKRVLVVEDEVNIATSLQFLLEQSGYDVTVVADGQSAIEAIESTVPDLLLLDLMLPGIDGYQVLQRLRANRSTSDLPVIVLTAKGQSEDRVLALQSGASLFVTKPFSNAELIEAVNKLTK